MSFMTEFENASVSLDENCLDRDLLDDDLEARIEDEKGYSLDNQWICLDVAYDPTT
jgi:hypothetical protein